MDNMQVDALAKIGELSAKVKAAKDEADAMDKKLSEKRREMYKLAKELKEAIKNAGLDKQELPG